MCGLLKGRFCTTQVAPLGHRVQARGVPGLDVARGKKQVWHPYVRTWGLSETNVLYWRKYLWHCFDFSVPAAVIRRLGNCAPMPPLVTPLVQASGGCSVCLFNWWCFLFTISKGIFLRTASFHVNVNGSLNYKWYCASGWPCVLGDLAFYPMIPVTLLLFLT